MIYLDHRTQEQITDLVEACARYWTLRGVAWEQSHEMGIELEEHLVQAALDGKTPGVVVGLNPAAFAESWAREMHPHMWRGGSTMISPLVYALGVVSTTALSQQLLTHASSFTLTLFTTYLLLSCGLVVLLIQLGGFLAPHIGTRTRRGLLLLAVGTLATLILREAGMRVNWSMTLLNWDWPLMIMLLMLTTFLFLLDAWRTAKIEQSSVTKREPLVRSILLFAGRVAMFDVLLFAGSAMVFNSCLLMGKFL